MFYAEQNIAGLAVPYCNVGLHCVCGLISASVSNKPNVVLFGENLYFNGGHRFNNIDSVKSMVVSHWLVMFRLSEHYHVFCILVVKQSDT